MMTITKTRRRDCLIRNLLIGKHQGKPLLTFKAPTQALCNNSNGMDGGKEFSILSIYKREKNPIWNLPYYKKKEKKREFTFKDTWIDISCTHFKVISNSKFKCVYQNTCNQFIVQVLHTYWRNHIFTHNAFICVHMV